VFWKGKGPRTGRTLRMFDTRIFDRVRQLQRSITEVERVGLDGTVELLQRSEFDTRWVYKDEMALLLRHTGYARWEVNGDFNGRTLTEETDGMIVHAWSASAGLLSPVRQLVTDQMVWRMAGATLCGSTPTIACSRKMRVWLSCEL
jgi:hypothetical protein